MPMIREEHPLSQIRRWRDPAFWQASLRIIEIKCGLSTQVGLGYLSR